jgi:hypothetical protein
MNAIVSRTAIFIASSRLGRPAGIAERNETFHRAGLVGDVAQDLAAPLCQRPAFARGLTALSASDGYKADSANSILTLWSSIGCYFPQ